jgi:hypothetical protein
MHKSTDAENISEALWRIRDELEKINVELMNIVRFLK